MTFSNAKSYGRGEVSEPVVIADRLRGHVEHLAAKIGERNLERPGTLEAAADYVEAPTAAQAIAAADPKVSANKTDAPPCNSTNGWTVRVSTGMVPRRKSSPTSDMTMPSRSTAVF